MQTSAPELIDLASETRRDPEAVRRRAGPAGLRHQLPAGPAAGRARRAVRAALPHRLGPPRQPRPDARPATSTRSAATSTSPCAALITRPEVARAARLDAGRLGRRVRPHADGRDPRDGRPQPPHRFDDDWMAGGGVKPGITLGETDEFGFAPSPTACTCTTSRRRSSTCWAWITPG